MWHIQTGGNKNTFNVDDVGYANASDVNMNTGSLTSSITTLMHFWEHHHHRYRFVSGKELSKWFDGQRDTKWNLAPVVQWTSVA